MNLIDATEEWRDWMVKSEYAARTVQGASDMVGLWIRRQGIQNAEPADISQDDIRAYIEQNYSASNSKALVLSHLKNFFDFCQASGVSKANPARLVKLAQRASQPKRNAKGDDASFTEAEITLLIEQAEPFWSISVALGYYGGLTLSNIANLTWGSFGDPSMIVVTDSEDGRIRHVPLNQDLARAIARIPIHLHASPQDYCFPNEKRLMQSPTKRSSLSVYFSRVCERFNIHGKSFRDLRRCYFAKLLDEGCSQRPTDHMLDFSHAKTALRYSFRSKQPTE